MHIPPELRCGRAAGSEQFGSSDAVYQGRQVARGRATRQTNGRKAVQTSGETAGRRGAGRMLRTSCAAGA